MYQVGHLEHPQLLLVLFKDQLSARLNVPQEEG